MISDRALRRVLPSDSAVALTGDLVRAVLWTLLAGVVCLWIVHYAWLARHMVQELNMNDFFPRAIAAYRYDRQAHRHGQGKLYALPFNTGGDMMFFNRQLFKEAGVPEPPLDGNWTIDDWLDRARRLSALQPGSPLLRTVGLSGRPSFRGNLSWLWARGAKFLDASGRRWLLRTKQVA